MLYSQALGQHDRALEVVDNALVARRDNVTLLNTKGLILLNAGRPTEATPVLQRAVELSCQLPLYCMHLAYALHLDGRPSQARRYFDSARDQLIPLLPNMTPENKAMYDTLHTNYPPVGGSFQ
jgi:Flp pilus assembly protein TadD